ncbi:hypothetical protein [Treponema sp.]|uniref:hypothetical protein n=1 Tax=Treponema sp. TaxID=166 RepID=UPI00388DB9F1
MKQKYNKDFYWKILCLCLGIFFLFSAGKNYYKLSRLEKYGIIENAVVKECSIKTTSGRSGIHYYVHIKYTLLNEELIQSCDFNFKPSVEYKENQVIQIIRDPENDFRIPVTEKEAFKRCEIKANLICAIGILFLVLLIKWVNYIFEKNRNKNKRRKKLAKKNPELKEKYKKEENVKTTIILILMAPFLLIQYCIEKLKNNKKTKLRKK